MIKFVRQLKNKAMLPKEFTIPYLIINIFCLALIIICARLPKTGRNLIVMSFFAVGSYVLYTSFYMPYIYIETFSKTAYFASYRNYFATGFKEDISFYIALYGFAFVLIALFLTAPKVLFRFGTVFGVAYLCLLTPLGSGSAFPAPVFMAIALLVLYVKYVKFFKSYKYN